MVYCDIDNTHIFIYSDANFIGMFNYGEYVYAWFRETAIEIAVDGETPPSEVRYLVLTKYFITFTITELRTCGTHMYQ
jgi:hypothetical protein